MQFVFVIGCQRSGTTLIGQILGAHPKAFFVDEDDGLYDSLERWRSGATSLYDALKDCFPKAASKYTDASRCANCQAGLDSHISHIVLKAPNATMFLDDFRRRKDEDRMHFVFPVRDVRDVVASMARLAHNRMTERQSEKLRAFSELLGLSPDQLDLLESENTPDIQKKAMVWVLKTGLIHEYKKFPLNTLWFRYEDFVHDREYWQRILFTHVELDNECAPNDHSLVYSGVGPGWTFRGRAVDSQSIGRWRNRLSAGEVSQVWEIAASSMMELGYDGKVADTAPEYQAVEAEMLAAPIIATGRGGSGTRLLSVMLSELGVFLGNRLNNTGDSIEWADLLYEIALGRLQGRSHPGWSQELRDRARAVLGRSVSRPELWGWKLPETMLTLEDCIQAFPRARLIQLVRHPVDLSLRRTHMTSRYKDVIGKQTLAKAYSHLGWKPKDARTDPDYRLNMASWKYQVEGASGFGRGLPADRYLELRYEDVCQNPQEVSNQLADFLGLPRIRTAVAAQLDNGRRCKWSWPDPRAHEVWETCGELAERLGYTAPEHLAAVRRSAPAAIDKRAGDAGPVLFVVGPALGHVGRSLLVAEEVTRRGHEVRFVGWDQYGFINAIIGPLFATEIWPNLRHDPEGVARLLEHTVSEMQPACIVLDTNPLPWLATWKRPSVPTVFLTNVFLTSMGPRSTIQDARFESQKTAWNKVRRNRGLPPLASGRTLYEATRVLLCDPPGLWDGETVLPPNYEWVGPCSWQPAQMALPETLRNAEDLFFISFGSTGLHDVPLAAIESIQARLQPRETVALHARAEIELPDVKSFERLPAAAVLERSMLSMTHGGTGSTYQALQKGVPVVIWPKHLNQQRLGEILQQRGLGILLGGKGWEHDVDRLVEQWDSLCTRVRAEAGRPWMRDGPARAASVIESLLGTTVAPEQANAVVVSVSPSREEELQTLLRKREAALKEAVARERTLRRKLNNSDRRKELVLRELQAVYASYSWYITAPIRALMDYLQKMQFRVR